MKERLFLVLAVALLVAAALVAPGVAPNGGAGLSNVVYADGEATPTPTPRGSNCQGGHGCGG